MQKAFIAEAQKKLLAEQERLERELHRSTGSDQHGHDQFHAKFPNYGDAEDDNAAEVADYQDRLSIAKDLETMHAEVLKALQQIEDGTYGTCRVCGTPISQERLAISPAATLCPADKEKGLG